jgi:hypothetical protein
MKPRLLDLFCKAGGCTKGYQRAGFYVVGVDKEHQPNYCGDEFIRGDAITCLERMVAGGTFEWKGPGLFDAVHASPPCQRYAGVTKWRGRVDAHPDLIGPVRDLLQAWGLPYVIENVPDARRLLHHPLLLCGTAFGLRVRRHRYFEVPWWPHPMATPCAHCPDDYSFDHGAKQPESVYRDAMGCEWMTVEESREAIPPAYTEHIGHYLMLEAERHRREAA